MALLSPLQTDAITEVFNIAVGQAASALSQMVDDEVVLSVPRIGFMSVREAANEIGQHQSVVCSVRQPFGGAMDGASILIFPEPSSMELTRALVGQQLPASQLKDIEGDAMVEVGNVVLNACLSGLATLLGQPFEAGALTLERSQARHALGPRPQNHHVLFIDIQFSLHASQVVGYMVFILNPRSLLGFMNAVSRFLDQGNGTASKQGLNDT